MFYRKIIQELEKWKESYGRKPLIIRGARQVGKTTVVHEFGKQFKQYIYVNLETLQDKELFQKTTDVHQLCKELFFLRSQQLDQLKESLLFIDEIQEIPTAVNLLRYFKEEIPELAVISAGSMLETLLGKNITFPVGRVEYKVLRPVSFEEFLGAIGEKMALEELQNVPLNTYAHRKLLDLFHTYAFLGGMPEIINHYAIHKDITALEGIYQSLINSYLEDAEKYAKSDTHLQLLRFCINEVMFQAGKRIKFQGFGNSNYKSREIGETLRTLAKTHLLHLVYPVTNYQTPLQEDHKKAPRLQFLDSGLLNHFVGLQGDVLGSKDLNSVYQGTLIEHLIGQELLSIQHQPLKKISFWVREKNTSQAELDFVHQLNGDIVPIEVKSGPTGSIKSLMMYMDEAPINYAIRFYAGELNLQTITTNKGKSFELLNLPYYLGTQIEKYIVWLKERASNINSVVKEPQAEYIISKPQKKGTTLDINNLSKKHLSVLEYCKDSPKQGKQIIEELLGISYQSKNKKVYINTLCDLDLLEWTDKEHPKSKKQSYKLTKSGLEILNQK